MLDQLEYAAEKVLDASPATVTKRTKTFSQSKTWKDLRIGIDEHFQFWAMESPSESKTCIRSKDKTPLEVKCDSQPGRILLALADSENGTEVKRSELVRVLKLIPSPPNDTRDGRTRPGAIESANREVLESESSFLTKRLNRLLTDVRRKLRQKLGVASHVKLLETDGEDIRAGFFVGYLSKDLGENLRFIRQQRN